MTRFLIAFACVLFISTFASGQSTVKAKDLKMLEGPKWTGTLTYLDYRSNKKTSIKSNLTVSRKSKEPPVWTFSYEYPDEPKANDSSEAILKDGGKSFFGETVVEKKYLPGKTLRMVTTQPGTDNNRKALFRYTYLVTSKTLSIKKEVQIEGSSDWFQRNEYSWTR